MIVATLAAGCRLNLRRTDHKEIGIMDDFTKRMIQNSARQAAEEMERKNRLDPNYKPTSPIKLILWPVGIIAAIALLFFFMGR
jgi:hypothetical protein